MKYPFLDLADANRSYQEALQQAAAEVIASGRYVGGPHVDALEQNMCRIAATDYAVGVSNGLDALRLILRAAILDGRLAEGDEIAVPANTYVASVLAITDAGLRPLLVEPDPATSNISAATFAAALTPATRGLMTVHLYGRSAWDPAIERLALERGLFVVEDAAQAIGAEAMTLDRGRCPVGSLGHAAAFSFYPTKNVGALGDAGAVTTSDRSLAEKIRALANYGSDRRYHNVYEGFNCRLDPIQAAMLNVKLADLDRINDLRRRRAKLYSELISNPRVVTPPLPADPKECVWHQYVVRCADRDRLAAYLASQGVATDIHYAVPPHRQPCYASLPHEPLPATEALAASILSLPIGDSTPPEVIPEIARIINSFE